MRESYLGVPQTILGGLMASRNGSGCRAVRVKYNQRSSRRPGDQIQICGICDRPMMQS